MAWSIIEFCAAARSITAKHSRLHDPPILRSWTPPLLSSGKEVAATAASRARQKQVIRSLVGPMKLLLIIAACIICRRHRVARLAGPPHSLHRQPQQPQTTISRKAQRLADATVLPIFSLPHPGRRTWIGTWKAGKLKSSGQRLPPSLPDCRARILQGRKLRLSQPRLGSAKKKTRMCAYSTRKRCRGSMPNAISISALLSCC